MEESGRIELGNQVRDARVAKGWGKEEAARQAGMSSITWKKVEDGKSVHDTSLAQVLQAVGLGSDSPADTPTPAISVRVPSAVVSNLSDVELEELKAFLTAQAHAKSAEIKARPGRSTPDSESSQVTKANFARAARRGNVKDTYIEGDTQ